MIFQSIRVGDLNLPLNKSEIQWGSPYYLKPRKSCKPIYPIAHVVSRIHDEYVFLAPRKGKPCGQVVLNKDDVIYYTLIKEK